MTVAELRAKLKRLRATPRADWRESPLAPLAVHEAGHAVACEALGIIASKATIEREGKLGGYVTHLPAENSADELVMTFCGTVAETIYKDGTASVSDAAAFDLKIATRIADEHHGQLIDIEQSDFVETAWRRAIALVRDN